MLSRFRHQRHTYLDDCSCSKPDGKELQLAITTIVLPKPKVKPLRDALQTLLFGVPYTMSATPRKVHEANSLS